MSLSLNNKMILRKKVEAHPVEIIRFLLGEKECEKYSDILNHYQKQCDTKVEFDVVLNEEDFIVSSR